MSQLQESTVLSEIRSNKIILPSLDELSSQLEQKMAQMTDFEKSGKYTEAENCKENVQKLKKEVHQKKLQNMVLGHKRQKRRIQKLHQEELNQVTTFWTNKISDFNSEAQKLKEQMETRHQSEIAAAKTQLEEQISNKMKESSECLNLRKMEEQMAKQKKYNEAHLIQQKIMEMEKKEKETFQKQRQTKIQAALMSLRNKQKTQRQALMKKTKSSQNELLKDKQIQINRLKHKNENIMKQLKSQQQKEVLAHKGQIKSKVTVSAVKSRSKIVLSTIN